MAEHLCQLCWRVSDEGGQCPHHDHYAPRDEIVARMVLDSCRRAGGEGDWWKDQHTACTGSHHVAPGEVVLCVCSCHVPKPVHALIAGTAVPARATWSRLTETEHTGRAPTTSASIVPCASCGQRIVFGE